MVARRVEHLNTDPRGKKIIDVAEWYAHGDATDAELNAAREAAGEAAWTAYDAEREWQKKEFLRVVTKGE